MAGYLLPSPRFRAVTDAGVPIQGAKAYFYLAGTSTPATTYADEDLLIPNTNPLIANSRGEMTVFLPEGTGYKLILNDANDVLIFSQDDIKVPSTAVAPAATDIPTGTIVAYGGAAAPSNWLLCDGSNVSRTTYAALFSAISTAFGSGDGSTTFSLPDLRGRFPLGKATAGTGSTLGGTGGSLDHTHTLAAHTHTITVSGGDHTHTVPKDGWGRSDPQFGDASGTLIAGDETDQTAYATNNVTTTGTGAHAHSASASTPSVDTSGTNNPAFQAVSYIIKT